MKRTTFFSFGSALVAATVMSFAAYGCGDDDDAATSKPDSGTAETGTPETGTPETSTGEPAAPTLGAQIDRMGRPAVNTALNHTFDPNAATADPAKDAWNANAMPGGWGAAFGPEVAANLAVYDGLDTTCGNQAAANPDAGATTNALKYGALAGVLADDRLWLNTAGTTAAQYLAVELDATGIAKNADRGGRTLPMDVIDVTYSALAVGDVKGVGDGIDADPAKTSGTTFPYLAAPK
jgi:hypothetical protein